jgi:hypothetical protein
MILLLKPALFRAVLEDGIGIDTTEGAIRATASSDPS